MNVDVNLFIFKRVLSQVRLTWILHKN